MTASHSIRFSWMLVSNPRSPACQMGARDTLIELFDAIALKGFLGHEMAHLVSDSAAQGPTITSFAIHTWKPMRIY